MRRLQPKIASRLAAELAVEGPCPQRFAVLLERLARLRADLEAGVGPPVKPGDQADPRCSHEASRPEYWDRTRRSI